MHEPISVTVTVTVNGGVSSPMSPISNKFVCSQKQKLTSNKNNNLAELHKRLNNIGLVDDLYVQEINSEYVLLKIKYLGKLEKIINELKKEKIILKQKNDEWGIKLIK